MKALAALVLAGAVTGACASTAAAPTTHLAGPQSADAGRTVLAGAAEDELTSAEHAPAASPPFLSSQPPSAAAATPAPAIAGGIAIAKPRPPDGPRRIGIQAGHWLTHDVPEELRGIESQTGASWGGRPEWQLNLEVATVVARALRERGYAVDLLPTAVPPGYVADVFVSLHADGDPAGVARGFKAANVERRGPHEARLLRAIVEEYGRATGLPIDPNITRRMTRYYSMAWSRYASAVAPHTPAVILEMGFMTSAADRAVLFGRQDLVAQGVVAGIVRFLDEVPRSEIFGEDLVLQPLPPFGHAGATLPPTIARP